MDRNDPDYRQQASRARAALYVLSAAGVSWEDIQAIALEGFAEGQAHRERMRQVAQDMADVEEYLADRRAA